MKGKEYEVVLYPYLVDFIGLLGSYTHTLIFSAEIVNRYEYM